jgi:Uri superfamily endonuclease
MSLDKRQALVAADRTFDLDPMLPDTEETLYVETHPCRTASHTLLRRGGGAPAGGLAGALDLHHATRAFTKSEFWTTADIIPAVPGAYVLAIELSEQVAVSLCRKPSALLCPGRYLYCGSAKGLGGLRGRLARHMRRGKSVRWHIDLLTEAGTVLGAWTFLGGDECDLVTGLSHLPIAIKGFGSTDCRRCTSHLLRWPHCAGTRVPT